MSIFSEFGGEIAVISRESGYAGGHTITHDHFLSRANISAHASLCRFESLVPGTIAGGSIGFTQVRFIDDAGATKNEVFARVTTGPGGVAVDKWPSLLYRPRVLMFTVAAFAIQASVKGSWMAQVWE